MLARSFLRACIGAVSLLVGCAEKPLHPTFTAATAPARATTQPLSYDEAVDARVCPPYGWHLDPPKVTDKHVHKTWVSPTGDSAYGVIMFKLPIPLTDELALWGFMQQMRKTEGEGILLEKQDDPKLPGVRFVAEGGPYKVRVNLTTHGLTGWAVYAGSLRARPENPTELDLAVAAREGTKFGKAE